MLTRARNANQGQAEADRLPDVARLLPRFG